MKQLNTFQNALMLVGAVALLAGAALIAVVPELWPKVVYCVGAVLFCGMQFYCGYEGNNFTVRRLRRQQLFGATCLLIAGALMLLDNKYLFGFYVRREWMIALAVGAVFELYTAFRLPAALEKESGKDTRA